MLRFNESQLQAKLFQETFREHGKCRIEEFWHKDSAMEIAKEIFTLPFSLAYSLNGLNREASEADLASLNSNQQKELLQSIHSEAAKGCGFLYGRFKVFERQNRVVSHVLSMLNNEETLSFIRDLSGDNTIVAADAQVTRFTPGNFLTRHTDNVAEEGRKLAYVLSFSEQWHPDWGGLLQFYHLSGKPLEAWEPKFNTLSIFDVKHIHSVTCVAPFAPKHRYSITGWFKSKAE